MKLKIIVSLFFFLSYLPAEETIRIYLNTTSPLQNCYINKISSNEPHCDKNYLHQIDSILRFDFNYNGKTKVVSIDSEKEKLLQKNESHQCFNPSIWQEPGISFVIKTTFSQNTLHTTVFSIQSKSIKEFPPVPLSGSMRTDRSLIHRLTNNIFQALYKENGIATTQILYCEKKRKNHKWISEVWICDFDGHNARQLTHAETYIITPVSFTKNADKKIIYVSYQSGQPKIVIASLDKEEKREKIVSLRGNQLLPAITKKGDLLAFISDVSGSADLFIQEFNPTMEKIGAPMQLFSYPNSTQASPTFNPDGSKIAFVSNKDGSPRIYVIPSKHTPKRATPFLLTKQNKENTCPAWSPDGKKLAYTAQVKGTRQIWIYDFETQKEWQLTDGPNNKENPAWAPNSNHIVFNSTDGHLSELYLVNLNQPSAIKISKGNGIKHYPAWVP
jgi:TolB protein